MTFENNVIEQEAIPSYEAVELNPLPREAMIVTMISTTIFITVLTLIAIPGYFLNIPLYTKYPIYWIAAWIVILLLSLYWIKLSHRYKGYALREHDVIYREGVIWRKTTILPFNRIQHVETQQGVLQRKYDIAKLQLFTAGGQRADLTINGMEVAITEGVKNRILNMIQSEDYSEEQNSD